MTQTFQFHRDTCYGCAREFSYDPRYTPHVMVDPVTDMPCELVDAHDGGDPLPALDVSAGRRAVSRPVCPMCARDVNDERRAAGLPTIPEADSLEALRMGGAFSADATA